MQREIEICCDDKLIMDTRKLKIIYNRNGRGNYNLNKYRNITGGYLRTIKDLKIFF